MIEENQDSDAPDMQQVCDDVTAVVAKHGKYAVLQAFALGVAGATDDDDYSPDDAVSLQLLHHELQALLSRMYFVHRLKSLLKAQADPLAKQFSATSEPEYPWPPSNTPVQ